MTFQSVKHLTLCQKKKKRPRPQPCGAPLHVDNQPHHSHLLPQVWDSVWYGALFVDGTAKTCSRQFVCVPAAHTAHDQFEEISVTTAGLISRTTVVKLKTHGFACRVSTRAGRAILAARRRKGRARPPARAFARCCPAQTGYGESSGIFRPQSGSGPRAGQSKGSLVHYRTDEDSDSRLVGFGSYLKPN